MTVMRRGRVGLAPGEHTVCGGHNSVRTYANVATIQQHVGSELNRNKSTTEPSQAVCPSCPLRLGAPLGGVLHMLLVTAQIQ